jgi:tRNA (mo5U34)-methyltransferase
MDRGLAHIRAWHERLGETGWWHSFEFPDGSSIQGVSTLAAQKLRIVQFPIPQDLTGKRVLDVGTWDGWFAMEMERRGAEVVAIDRFENPRFLEIHERMRSRVDYRQLSVYDLDPNRIGRFDVVLFLGVLYHLKHPLLALERVCSVAKDFVAVESFVLKEERPLMEFYENDEFGGEFDNWFAPTVPCLLGLCRTAGFARVELNNVQEYGAAVTCYRRWIAAGSAKTALRLLAVFHAGDRGINFQSSSSDEYVICRVAGDAAGLSRDTVYPEVDGFGAQPVFVNMVEGCCQVGFKLPPGLSPGWHEVRLRTPEAESNPMAIAVDVPLVAEALSIASVADGVSWEPSRVSKKNRFLSFWVRGLPGNADLNNIRVYISGRRQITDFVGVPAEDGIRQINAILSGGVPPGVHPMSVRFGVCESPAIDLEITG